MSEQEQPPPGVKITLFGGGGAEISAPIPTPQEQVPAAPVLRPPVGQPPPQPPPDQPPPATRQPPGRPVEIPPFPGGRFGQGFGRGGISGGRGGQGHVGRSNRFVQGGGVGHGPGVGGGGGNNSGPVLIGHTGRKPTGEKGGGIGGGGNGKLLPAPFIRSKKLGLQSVVGSFVTPAGIGNQTYSLPGNVPWTPKAIIIYSCSLAIGSSSNAHIGIGFAISPSSRVAVSVSSQDNQATSDTRRRSSVTECIEIADVNGILVQQADLVSFGPGQFTLSWSVSAGAGDVFFYIALGGDALNQVAIKEFTSPVLVQPKAETGVGFKSDCIIVLGVGTVGAASTGECILGLGFATAALVQGANGVSSQNGEAAAQDTDHGQLTTRIINLVFNNASWMAGALTSIDNDGFTINYTVVNATARTFWALCLKGGQYEVGEFSQTGPGAQAVATGVTKPNTVILTSVNDAVDAAQAAQFRFSLGAGSSPTEQGCIWSGDVDGAGTSETNRDADDTQIIKMMTATAGAPTTQAAADLVSLSPSAINVNWSIADATARKILYLAIG